MKIFTFICIITVFNTLLQCSHPVISNSGNSGIDNKTIIARISGNITDSLGNPSINAHITMRSKDYLASIDKHIFGKRLLKDTTYEVHTNGTGFFEIIIRDSANMGVYCIEAWDTILNYCLFIDSIVIDSAYLKSDSFFLIPGPRVKTDAKLRPPGKLAGTFRTTNDSTKIFIRVYGLDTYSEVDSTGHFVIENIPQGNYQLQIETIQKNTSYQSNVNARTIAGTVITIDTLIYSLYHILYNGNGNTSGTVPVDSTWYDSGQKITIIGNPGDIKKAGFRFKGWNTRKDGNGVTYREGDIFLKSNEKQELYATWVPDKYSLLCISNGNGTVSGSDSVAPGVPHSISASSNSGYIFSVWRVKSGTAIIRDSTAASTTITIINGDVVVDASFTNTFEIAYHAILVPYGDLAQQTNDNGYIILGSTNNPFLDITSAIKLVKTDSFGKTLWTKVIAADSIDCGTSILQTSDGGYVITGFTVNPDGNKDLLLIKVNSSGDKLWSKKFGGHSTEIGNALLQTSDDGFIIAGYTGAYGNGDVFLVKTDNQGNELWSKNIGGDSTETIHSLQYTSDGGYIIAGYSFKGNDYTTDICLLRTDADGNMIWKKTLGGDSIHYGYSAHQTNDGGYIIVGSVYMNLQNDLYIVKTDNNGNGLWSRTYSGTGNEYGFSVLPINDGYVIIGSTSSFGNGKDDVYFIKLDTLGNGIWSRTFGGSDNEAGYSVHQTNDGGFIIAGSTSSFGSEEFSAYLIKTDKNGNAK